MSEKAPGQDQARSAGGGEQERGQRKDLQTSWQMGECLGREWDQPAVYKLVGGSAYVEKTGGRRDVGQVKTRAMQQAGGEGIMGNGGEPPLAGHTCGQEALVRRNLPPSPKALHRRVGCSQGNHVLQSWQKPSQNHGGRPKQPRGSGHLPLELGHRTQDTAVTVQAPTAWNGQECREACGRGGSHARLWGSRQVTLSLCTLGVVSASEQG